MSLESATYVNQLSQNNPASSDPRSNGDDHLRLIKNVLKRELSATNREWIYTGDTVVRVSATAFTIADSDRSGPYNAGRKIKVVGDATGTIYGTISSSTYSSSTAVNINFDSGSMANESLVTSLAILNISHLIGARLLSGSGSPESVVAAPVGSLYMRTDGSTGTSLYVKETGTTGNTGWVAK